VIGAAAGFLVASGLVLVIAAWLSRRQDDDRDENPRSDAIGLAQKAGLAALQRRREMRVRLKDRLTAVQVLPIVAAVAVGLTTIAVTRWPVAAAGGAVIAFIVTTTLMSGGASDVAGRAEGVAVWVETVRDLVAGGLGLESAIMTACRSAPKALAVEFAEMVLEVERGRSVRESIAAAAGRIANPTADIAVAVLLLTLEGQVSRPVEVLSHLARDARDHVSRIAEIEAARASARTTMRMVMVVMGLGIGVFFLFGRSYLAPYGTILGQMVLAGIMAVLVASFAWMRKLISIKEQQRIIIPEAMKL